MNTQTQQYIRSMEQRFAEFDQSVKQIGSEGYVNLAKLSQELAQLNYVIE